MTDDRGRQHRERRAFLKQATVGVATLVGIGTTAGVSTAADTQSKPETPVKNDPDFDPSDPQAVRDFVERTFQWSNEVRDDPPENQTPREVIREKRNRVLNALSRRQKLAVSDLLDQSKVISRGKGRNSAGPPSDRGSGTKTIKSSENPESAETSSGNDSQTDVGTLSCNSYSDTVTGVIKVPGIGEFTAFNFTQDIGWCVSNNKVGSVVPKARASPRSYILIKWDYAGKSDSQLSFHPEKYYAISYLEGRFQRCVLVNTSFSCVRNDYGYVEAVVYNDRSGRTLTKGTF